MFVGNEVEVPAKDFFSPVSPEGGGLCVRLIEDG